MRKYLMALVLAVTTSSPVLAATEFYVVQDAKTHKCSVSDKKPDGKTMMMIGKAAFKTNAEATTALKAAKECNS